MRRMVPLTVLGLLAVAALSPAYVEVPYSLGQVIRESRHIMLLEVVKVDKTKNLILFKKLENIKGKDNATDVKHNIGKNGFHPREWQNIMAWAAKGKKAVFFHNGGASETCIGTYWYQCYRQGQWWGMSHAEPFLLRSYFGKAEHLAEACKAILQGKEVVVPCMKNVDKKLLHLRKAPLQLLKASLKRSNYNPKRDFVADGAGGFDFDIPQYKTTVLLKQSSPGWKFFPAAEVVKAGDAWKNAGYDDKAWRTGQAPIGYGEPELTNRKGTLVEEKGVPFVFRRSIDIPQQVLAQSKAQFRLSVACDNCANVWLNGQQVLQEAADHEFSYWNHEIELKPAQFKPGANVFAALVNNTNGSSDIFFDIELAVQVLLPKKTKPKPAPNTVAKNNPAKPAAKDNAPPKGLTVDKAKRTVTAKCVISPRKLPHLNKVFPLEVVACYPHPKGQKAHETIVNITGMKPSHVHKALVECGLKPGKPAKGEGAKATGPELVLLLEFVGTDGKMKRLPIEKLLVNTKTNQPVPPLKWHFTGSALKNLDPEKDDVVYAADYTGTLIAIFPVTDDTVIQTHLTLKEEAQMKLDIAPGILPKYGSPAKLIIQAK